MIEERVLKAVIADQLILMRLRESGAMARLTKSVWVESIKFG